jgi:hypothetical protein
MLKWMAFAVNIAAGGAHGVRTVGALSLRSPLRIAVALVTQRAVKATAVGSSPR